MRVEMFDESIAERSAQEVVKPLEQGLQEVRGALGERAAQLLPEIKPVTEIRREDYTSRTYAVEEGPTIKQSVDGNIYEVAFGDGSKTFVLRHKTTGGNPFADPAFWGELLPEGGLDSRKWETFTYEWDGQTAIKATAPDGKVTEVKGQYGTPDAMLPTLRQSLGHPRGTQSFTNTPQSAPIANPQ